MIAADRNNTATVKLLLEKGANLEDKDKDGNTALMISAKGNAHPTANVVKLLLKRC